MYPIHRSGFCHLRVQHRRLHPSKSGYCPHGLFQCHSTHIEFLKEQVKSVKKRLLDHIQAHDTLQHQHEILTSIVGIGDSSAARVLAEIGSIEHFQSARQLVAFAGLTPQEHESDTLVRGKTRLCKIGNCRLRKTLYFPALHLMGRCPQMQGFRERLLAAG